jgi:hypothetical protein
MNFTIFLHLNYIGAVVWGAPVWDASNDPTRGHMEQRDVSHMLPISILQNLEKQIYPFSANGISRCVNHENPENRKYGDSENHNFSR